MSLLISTIIFIASFAAAFIVTSKLLRLANDKYNIFGPIHAYIKNSGKQTTVTRFISMLAFFIFIFIANRFQLNDWLFGIVLGLCSSIILAILEPKKGSK